MEGDFLNSLISFLICQNPGAVSQMTRFSLGDLSRKRCGQQKFQSFQHGGGWERKGDHEGSFWP